MKMTESESFYARIYGFGKKLPYDENHPIVLQDKVIFGFNGKNNQKVEKVTRFESTCTKRTFKLKGVIDRAEIVMEKEYRDYQGSDLVEGIEITQEKDHTYIWIYRPFVLTKDRIFIPKSEK
jgi:hypothetical protein